MHPQNPENTPEQTDELSMSPRKWRKSENLTLKDLSKRMNGISASYLSQVETGKKPASGRVMRFYHKLSNGRGDESDGPVYADVHNVHSLWLGCSTWVENCESGSGYYGRANVNTDSYIDLGGYIDGSLNGDYGTI